MEFQRIIKRGFSNVLNFSGRDSAREFLVFNATVIVSLLLFSVFFFLEDAIASVRSLEAFKNNQFGTGSGNWTGGNPFTDNTSMSELRSELELSAIIDGAKLAFTGLVLPLTLTASSMVRRFHDAGLSGNWLLVLLVVGLFVFFPALPILLGCLAFLKSEKGANSYGPARSSLSTQAE